MISQRQLAAHLKLSPGTVSRALRNMPGTDAATQARVLEVAAKLGYRMPQRPPSRGELAAQRTDRALLLGLLISYGDTVAVKDGIFSSVMRGCAEAARELGASLQVDYVAGERLAQIHDPQQQAPALREGLVSGLVLVGLFAPEVVAALAAKVPCVRLNIRDASVKLDCIAQDDLQAVEDLAAHLVALGHRQIGYFCTPHDMAYTFGGARFGGYVQALAQHRLPLEPDWWLGVRESESVGETQLLDRAVTLARQGVRAWIAVNDDWGYRLIAHFAAAGLRVPEDVSVVGFDAVAVPPGQAKLTSVEWPFEDMGAAAVRRLVRRVKDPFMAVGRSVYTGKLVPGATTGRCG